MLSEKECQTAVLQYLFIWEATNEFFKFDPKLDFSSQQKKQQDSVINFLDCLILNNNKDSCNDSYYDLQEISKRSYFDACVKVLNFGLSKYPSIKNNDDNIITNNKCHIFSEDISNIVNIQPEHLKPIMVPLSENDFERHQLHILAYSKYPEYGEAIQKLVSALEAQTLKKDVIYSYEEIMS